jgi:hypothetical protein
MPILRVSKKQLQEAGKARETALAKNKDFRLHDEQRRRAPNPVPANAKPEQPR